MNNGQFSLPFLGGVCGSVALSSATLAILWAVHPLPFLVPISPSHPQLSGDFLNTCGIYLSCSDFVGALLGIYLADRFWRNPKEIRQAWWMWGLILCLVLYVNTYTMLFQALLAKDLNPIGVGLGGLFLALGGIGCMQMKKLKGFRGWA